MSRTAINPAILDQIFQEIEDEFRSASENFPPFASEHEGYAVLLEEVDELWEAVKLNQKRNPNRQLLCQKEAKQVAAMAIRFLYDCYWRKP